jgi:hypothetical protein
MKSVPNLISYLHDFFQNFSQSLAICFEQFSFGVIFNSKITDSGPHMEGPALRARASRARLKALSGQRATRPDSTPRARPTAPASPALSSPDSATPRARCRCSDRLARNAVTRQHHASHVSPSSRPPHRPRRHPDRSLAVDAAPPSAVPAPMSRRSSAVSRTPAQRRRRALRSRAPRTARAGQVGPCALRRPGPSRAAPALCDWADRDFGPVAPG